eukprot:794454-Lingulodinium_polyedra.AAC.1
MDLADDVANAEEVGVADDIKVRVLTTAIGHAIAMQAHGDGPTTPVCHANHWVVLQPRVRLRHTRPERFQSTNKAGVPQLELGR